MTDAIEVVIEKLGAKGDGVVRAADGDRFVPGALPGERWRLGPGVEPERITASPDRAVPPCPHFGTCGGCMAQHMSQSLYLDWKLQIVREAFQHRGIAAEVEPVRPMPLRSRRRAFLGIERRGSDVHVGFREEGQHTLVDIKDCLLLDPAIMAALPQLKAMARIAMPDRTSGRLIVTKLATGLDVSSTTATRC